MTTESGRPLSFGPRVEDPERCKYPVSTCGYKDEPHPLARADLDQADLRAALPKRLYEFVAAFKRGTVAPRRSVKPNSVDSKELRGVDETQWKLTRAHKAQLPQKPIEARKVRTVQNELLETPHTDTASHGL